jgi:hypothetical protein
MTAVKFWPVNPAAHPDIYSCSCRRIRLHRSGSQKSRQHLTVAATPFSLLGPHRRRGSNRLATAFRADVAAPTTSIDSRFLPLRIGINLDDDL